MNFATAGTRRRNRRREQLPDLFPSVGGVARRPGCSIDYFSFVASKIIKIIDTHTGTRECTRLSLRGDSRDSESILCRRFFRYSGEVLLSSHTDTDILRKYKVRDINNLLHGKNNLCMKSLSIEWQKRADVILC